MSSKKSDLVLALDLGTTGNRAVLYDGMLKPIARAYREFTQYFPRPGWVEHDPEEILRSTRQVLRAVLAAAGSRPIAALGITNQRETVVVWDRATGKPVHRAIVWQCRRTTDTCRRLKAQGWEPWIHRRTGLFLDPYFSATKILWLLEHVQAAKSLARKGRLLAGTMDTWLLWHLAGAKTHATDPSNASRTMLFNLKKMSWDSELLDLFNVPPSVLPEVLNSRDDFGVTEKSFAGASIPIRAVLGDQQASMFGQGCWRPGQYKNTYGTGLFLMTPTGGVPQAGERVVTTVAWKEGDKTEYALEGSIFIGGAAMQWLRDGVKIIRDAKETQALASRLKSNEGVYFVPAFVGLGAPEWDPTARGMIIGITRGTRREHLARAALESMAFQTAQLVQEMQRELKVRPKILLADGGATSNAFLMQFQADVLGCPVARSGQAESTALGVAMMAGLQAGLWDRDFLCKVHLPAAIYKPQMPRKEITQLMSHWTRAVERSKGWA